MGLVQRRAGASGAGGSFGCGRQLAAGGGFSRSFGAAGASAAARFGGSAAALLDLGLEHAGERGGGLVEHADELASPGR